MPMKWSLPRIAGKFHFYIQKNANLANRIDNGKNGFRTGTHFQKSLPMFTNVLRCAQTVQICRKSHLIIFFVLVLVLRSLLDPFPHFHIGTGWITHNLHIWMSIPCFSQLKLAFRMDNSSLVVAFWIVSSSARKCSSSR